MRKTTALCIVSTHTKRHSDNHQTTAIFHRFPPLFKTTFSPDFLIHNDLSHFHVFPPHC
ncbi:hypothetical protein HMPREF9065_01584 [Aggregatibacter sp. oral taxon 458 str. W10330]|nr:hypothetical protein HMPREF9065_01584 [Aggregatibacter sp. oral taxon 458 str. W10330]